MLKPKGNKAFTLIEILVVIVIIIIFVIFAAPNVANYATEREVKKEVYALVEYIEKKKTEVNSGQYGMAWIRISGTPGQSSAWIMSHSEWAEQMKVPAPARTAQNNLSKYDNKSILNHSRACSGGIANDGGYNDAGTQKYTESSDTFNWSSNVTSSSKYLCIAKDGMINTDGENQNGISGKTWLIICSTSNTGSGSKRCYWNKDKLDYRYVIKINPGLKIEVYKYNLKKDKWILQ